MVPKPPVASLPARRGSTAGAPEAREDEPTQDITHQVEAPSDPPPPLSVPSDLVGAPPEAIARFGRFEIMGGLASGGMADILLARESTEGSSRHTIIKVVRGEHSETGSFAQMFLDEGRLAMRLSHPNICTVYECGEVDGRYFIAMEYVHGKTLRDVLVRSVRRKQPLPIKVVVKVFSWVAEALDYAHRARDAQGTPLDIVHRDVSPHNVMIRYDGVVKLLDFGVAKATKRLSETESGALKGKFAYMSPEQAEGDDEIDSRSDIFSLGVMLFEAITGRRLFHRKNQYATLKALFESDPPRLREFRPDAPDELQRIVDKALARVRDDRYARASDMQHDLERFLTSEGKTVIPAHVSALMIDLFGDTAHQPISLKTGPEVTARFGAIGDDGAPEVGPDLAPIAPGEPRRAGLLVGVAAAALALLGIGLAVGAWASGDEPPPVRPIAAPAPTPDPPVEPTAVEPPPEPPAAPPAEVESPPAEPAPDEPPPEEIASETEPTAPTTRRRRRRGRRGGARRGGAEGETVIVSDPGF